MSAMRGQIGPIRLHESEEALIKEAAAKKGKTAASWIRLCAVTASKRVMGEKAK